MNDQETPALDSLAGLEHGLGPKGARPLFRGRGWDGSRTCSSG